MYTIHYNCLVGWRAALGNEIELAVEMFTEAMKVARDIGSVAPAIYCCHGLANALFAKGDIDGARENLNDAKNNIAARKMCSLQYQLLLSEAYFEIKTGNRRKGLVALNEALTLGQKTWLFSNSLVGSGCYGIFMFTSSFQ